MANELVLIETKIKEGDAAAMAADRYTHKMVEMKIAAGKLYSEARDMCFAAGINWVEKCKEVTTRSYAQVSKYIQIAGASDPYAEEKRQRETKAEGMRNLRETSKDLSHVGETSQSHDVDLSTIFDSETVEETEETEFPGAFEFVLEALRTLPAAHRDYVREWIELNW